MSKRTQNSMRQCPNRMQVDVGEIADVDSGRCTQNGEKFLRKNLIVLLLVNVFADVSIAAAEGRSSISLDEATRSRCVEILRTGMRCDDFWPSIHAAEGLTLAGHGNEVIEFLTPLLPKETDDQRRCGISRELVRAGDRSKAAVMLKILAGSDSYGHVHAAESLYKVFAIGDGTAMRKAYEESEIGNLKLMSAGALARCGNPDAIEFLRRTLKHEDPEILRIAAWLLGRVGDGADIPRLKQQLPRCQDIILNAYVHHALATLGDADGLKALAANLESDDPAVRTYAATFAGDAWATGVRNQLIKVLDDEHPDAAIRAAQSLLQMASKPHADRHEDISRVVYPSTKKNPRYTEGSVLELNDGSLLFAVTEFGGSGSDFADANIVAQTSHDEGRTWSGKRVLQKNIGGMNVMSVTLKRLANGNVAMFYLQKNSHTDLDMHVRFSDDETQSFSEPVLVTSDEGYHVVNNDRILQLASGRLIVPAASTPDVAGGGHFKCHCYLSDDHGKTWQNSKGEIDAEKRGAMEPEVIELSDGRILMLIRTQLGYIGKSYSSDGGRTWSPMASLGVKAPEAPCTVRRIPSTGDLVLVWNNTYAAGTDHGGKRTPLTIGISGDEGETWRVVSNLEDDRSRTYSYTSLTFCRDRIVMSYWDSGEGTGKLSCRFRSQPVSWLYQRH